MRLGESMLLKIKSAAHDSFGDAKLYLFGSRVDDSRKGGDIDIAVDANLSKIEFRKKKVKFIAQLLRNDFELKVDIVDYHTKDELLSKTIREKGVLL